VLKQTLKNKVAAHIWQLKSLIMKMPKECMCCNQKSFHKLLPTGNRNNKEN